MKRCLHRALDHRDAFDEILSAHIRDGILAAAVGATLGEECHRYLYGIIKTILQHLRVLLVTAYAAERFHQVSGVPDLKRLCMTRKVITKECKLFFADQR